MNVGIISDETFKSHHGIDLTDNDHEGDNSALPKVYRILRTTKVSEFAKQVAEEKELVPDQVRFWVMVNRQNKTMRPDQPLRNMEMSVEEAYGKFGSRGNTLFKLWLDVAEVGEDEKYVWPETQGPNASILIFLKNFDVPSQTLTGVSHLFVRKQSKVSELDGPILEMMGWPAGTPFLLFEVCMNFPCQTLILVFLTRLLTGNQAVHDRTNKTKANLPAIRDTRW